MIRERGTEVHQLAVCGSDMVVQTLENVWPAHEVVVDIGLVGDLFLLGE